MGDNHLIYGSKMSDKNTWDHEVVDDLVMQTSVAVETIYGDQGQTLVTEDEATT